jgi:adenosylcobinamide-GDP ribazoletransferase
MVFWRKFLVAVKLFTTLPVPENIEDISRAKGVSKYFISIGIIIGLWLYVITVLFAVINIKTNFYATSIVALLILVLWYSITGLIHLDGLAKTFSAMMNCAEKPVKINMIESGKLTTAGNVGVFFVLLFKLTTLVALLEIFYYAGITTGDIKILLMLLMVPVISRFSAVYAIGAFPYIRKPALAKEIKESTAFPLDIFLSLIQLLILFMLIIFFVFTEKMLVLVFITTFVPSILLSVIVPLSIHSMLGGHTDETYGACIEIVETGILLIMVFSFMAVS